jgi:transposase InsO family protein
LSDASTDLWKTLRNWIAEHEILHWISFYNAERLHEALGDLPPAEYEHLKYQDRQPPMLSAR